MRQDLGHKHTSVDSLTSDSVPHLVDHELDRSVAYLVLDDGGIVVNGHLLHCHRWNLRAEGGEEGRRGEEEEEKGKEERRIKRRKGKDEREERNR